MRQVNSTSFADHLVIAGAIDWEKKSPLTRGIVTALETRESV
jgi:hypothetical protein